MFNVRKLVEMAVISAGLLFGVSATSVSANHVTRIAHPRANMMFNTKSVYYNSPHKAKHPLFPQEMDQIWSWSGLDPHQAVPDKVEPYLKTTNHGQVWYKFVKPSMYGDVTIRDWIPAYGLSRYPHYSKSYLRKHTTAYTFGKTRMNKRIAHDLYVAKIAHRDYVRSMNRAKADRVRIQKALHNAYGVWDSNTDKGHHVSTKTLLYEADKISEAHNTYLGIGRK